MNTLWQEEELAELEVPAIPPRVQYGDLWQLGRHYIACIDSTDGTAVQNLLQGRTPQLLFADPPYGVNEKTARKSAGRSNLALCNDFPPVIGDNKPFDPTQLLNFSAKIKIIWGANHFANRLPNTSSWIVWDKRDGISSNDNADCEIAWSNAGGPARLFVHRWSGMIKASEQQERRLHPTQKPIALAEWCIKRYSNKDDLIYDPYLGSGISILAAERTRRIAYGCELSPAYCDVILYRWQRLTGKQAVLIARTELAS